MRVLSWVTICFCSLYPLAFGASWRGLLVDAKCYAAEQRNHNPTDTSTAVDEDKGQMVRYCSPKAKTKSFGIVGEDGSLFRLDPSGESKAAELVRRVGKRQMLEVAVSGTLRDHIIQTDSVAPAK
jgi:hypothetical protein